MTEQKNLVSPATEALLAAIRTAVDNYLHDFRRSDSRPVFAGDEFGGGCPECHQNDGHLQLQGSIYYVCLVHRLTWCHDRSPAKLRNEQRIAKLAVLTLGLAQTHPWFPPEGKVQNRACEWAGCIYPSWDWKVWRDPASSRFQPHTPNREYVYVCDEHYDHYALDEAAECNS